jgi:hypothetical protein
MNAEVKKADVVEVERVLAALYDWSGVSEDTPDDYEVVSDPSGLNPVTLGDLRTVLYTVSNLKNMVK